MEQQQNQRPAPAGRPRLTREQWLARRRRKRLRLLRNWVLFLSACGMAVGLMSWQRKVFQALKEVQEVTFAEVPIMEHSQHSGHIIAAMEVSHVRIQVYAGADKATLQAILQAAKSC